MPHLAALAREADAIASELRRMPFTDHRFPHAPHETRSELVGKLCKLADAIRAGALPAVVDETPAPAPTVKERFRPFVIVDNGRRVPVVKR